MRTLTIHREKSLAGCIMPVSFYIVDEIEGDMKINGEMCRLLGSVRNGQTKTFPISGRRAVLYGAYGKSDLYFDRFELPCSDRNITISGKCTLRPNMGNPFIFHRPSLSADKIEAVIKTAGLIAQGDKEVIYTVRDMVVKPMEYFAAHSEEYLERGIDDWSNLDEVVWLGMVDILIRHHYAIERDYKDEIITGWCATIDDEWKNAGYCMGCIDIKSDSYVLFLTDISLMDRLNHYAACLGYAIVYAEDN